MSARSPNTGPTARGNGATVLISTLLSIATFVTGCASVAPDPDPAWAVNVGGPAYVGVDGTAYAADSGINRGTARTMSRVLGSQDDALYLTFGEGDLRIARPVADGTYDITFHFAEPEPFGPGERVFDVYAEKKRVIGGLDVMQSRDGKTESALTVTVPRVDVSDGTLDITFEASAGQPILSALVVRRHEPAPPSWRLAWRDEFDAGGGPDPARWNVDVWPPRKVNDENQAYTARKKNLRVEDGYLVIEAHKESFAGAEYTSARIHSAGKGDFLYGRIEVRAMLPEGKGTWPAIWMLPTDPFRYATKCSTGDDWQGNPDCDAWPKSGEIDIMEHVGYQMGHVHATVHNEAYYWVNWQQRKGRILLDDVAREFHVYALEWTPERIDAYVDDTLYFTYVNENEGWRAWPYDHPFHLVLNVAVGGYWGRAGGGIDDTIFPQRMLIDYVRVYEAR